MFSCANPENDEITRNAASTRSSIVLSDGPGGSGTLMVATRRVSARQASGENRSRITEAAERAAAARCGSEPSNEPRMNAARAISIALACGISLGPALQAASRSVMRAITGADASSCSVTRWIRARTSRKVASARST